MLYGDLRAEWTALDLRTNHDSAVLCPCGVAIPKTCFKWDVLFCFTASSLDLARAVHGGPINLASGPRGNNAWQILWKPPRGLLTDSRSITVVGPRGFDLIPEGADSDL